MYVVMRRETHGKTTINKGGPLVVGIPSVRITRLGLQSQIGGQTSLIPKWFVSETGLQY